MSLFLTVSFQPPPSGSAEQRRLIWGQKSFTLRLHFYQRAAGWGLRPLFVELWRRGEMLWVENTCPNLVIFLFCQVYQRYARVANKLGKCVRVCGDGGGLSYLYWQWTSSVQVGGLSSETYLAKDSAQVIYDWRLRVTINTNYSKLLLYR